MFVNGLVNLHTADIEAAIRCYRDILGLEETFRAPGEGVPEHAESALASSPSGSGRHERPE